MTHLKTIFFVTILLISQLLVAQKGTLMGKITEKDSKTPIPFTNIVIEAGGKQFGGATSDMDGKYTIRPIAPGKYTVKIRKTGYRTNQIDSVRIKVDMITFLSVSMEKSSSSNKEIIKSIFNEPIVSNPPLLWDDNIKEIQTIPAQPIIFSTNESVVIGGVHSISGIVASVRGCSTEGTVTYIDGVRVRGSSGSSYSSTVKRKRSGGISFAPTYRNYRKVEKKKGYKEPKSEKKSSKLLKNEKRYNEIWNDKNLTNKLTAGEINDFTKWVLWNDISKNELAEYAKLWNFLPQYRFCVQLTNNSSNPVVDARVKLLDKNQNVVWETKTDNTGKAEL